MPKFPSFALARLLAVGMLVAVPFVAHVGAAHARGRSRIIVEAHRGGAALAPENTLAAYRNAIRLGADYVEIDVRRTRDGKLVIMHDRTVDRTTDGKGEVAQLTYREISRLNAAAKFPGYHRREHVPTLEEVVHLCRGKIGVYVDHKSAPVRDVLAVLERAQLGDAVLVYGDVPTLKEYRSLNLTLLLMPTHPSSISELRTQAISLSPMAFDGSMDRWTVEEVQEAHSHGAPVWMNVLGATDNEKGFERAIAMGADGLETDHPDLAIAFLKSKGLR